MIHSIGPAIAAKPIIANVAASRVFNVSINNSASQKTAVTGWNMWGNDNEANTLLTDAGAASTLRLRRDPSFYFDETESYSWVDGTDGTNGATSISNKPSNSSINYPAFWRYPSSILCFRGSQSILKFNLTGLDDTKIYGITSLMAMDYDDSTSETAISFDGGTTTFSMGVPTTRKACWYYKEVTPVSGTIAIWLRAVKTGDGYTCINSFQFKEI